MRAFLLIALLASTQAITLNKKDDGASPPVEGKEEKCEMSKDGIKICVAPGDPNWSVDMDHQPNDAGKVYKTIKIPGTSPKDEPILKDNATPLANEGVEASAGAKAKDKDGVKEIKKAKKEALIQAAALSKKKSKAQLDFILAAANANSTRNATVKANATKNVTANSTKNVTANITANATKNITANASKNVTMNATQNVTKNATKK